LSNAAYHLSASEIARVIEAGRTGRDRLLLRLLAETGMRRSEVANLGIEDIRFADGLLLIRRGKGDKLRLVPVSESIIEKLKAHIGSAKSGPVFVSLSRKKLSLRQINRIVAAAGHKAGVKNPNPRRVNVTPHLFRHSFARLWKEKGGSIETLSKILGHQSQATTWDLYGSESLNDIRRNYSRMIRKLFPFGKPNQQRTR